MTSTLTNEAPKLCINCEHCSMPPTREANNARCFAPENRCGVDLVDGTVQYAFKKCQDARRDFAFVGAPALWPWPCGPSGKWFIPREEKPAPVTISSILKDLNI